MCTLTKVRFSEVNENHSYLKKSFVVQIAIIYLMIAACHGVKGKKMYGINLLIKELPVVTL